jgi:allantoinase
MEQWHLDRDSEKESIHKAVVAIEKTTGRRPLGWFTKSGPSLNTREILAEEGFLYDCDGINDDLPYYTEVKDKPWLVVPYAFDSNDGKYWRGAWSNGEQFLSYLKDSFDMLYKEGATHPKILSIGLHSRVSGRPGRLRGLVPPTPATVVNGDLPETSNHIAPEHEPPSANRATASTL